MKSICNDLRKEYEALHTLVWGITAGQWQIETAFNAWTIYDEICYLAFVDGEALLAISDQRTFKVRAEQFLKRMSREPSVSRISEQMTGGKLPVKALLQLWLERREQLLARLDRMGTKDQLPWYGPDMNALGFVTARLMETWAHGQDIYDALGLQRENTDRIWAIANRGVTTFEWSYANRKLSVPEDKPYVELWSPSGKRWIWGESDAVNRIMGRAEDFCLVVTQRRNVDDTGIVTEGEVAKEWMKIAQCFSVSAL